MASLPEQHTQDISFYEDLRRLKAVSFVHLFRSCRSLCLLAEKRCALAPELSVGGFFFGPSGAQVSGAHSYHAKANTMWTSETLLRHCWLLAPFQVNTSGGESEPQAAISKQHVRVSSSVQVLGRTALW
ncbi:unnamed protein product [Symbiodinium natans]|uniref:Uncharacterized protein n=1 Tax=Symbiodinium natans TaxID=878477 RepID=A0A812UZI3_9DINO|nr:unnamed protein product [Symbiodinium natans]